MNLAQGGDYTLRGTEILKELSSYVYDRPLFHHPPLFPVLLVPFVLLDAGNAAVVVSWLGHFLSVLAVALIGRYAINSRAQGGTITAPAFWLPVLGAATDPLMMFVSRRVWIDSLLSGLVALAVATLLIAEGRRRAILLTVAGMLLGLASLAKLTALVLLPLFLFACLRHDVSWKQRLASTLRILVPVAFLVLPWFLLFYAQTGVFVPPWVKPDARLMELYPFVRVAVERPWYYYLVKLVLIMPLAVVVAWVLVRETQLWRNHAVRTTVAWFVVPIVTLTLMGMDGYGFQMRHIAPAVTAVYVLILWMLLERDRPILLMACAFTTIIGTVTGAMHLLAPQFDEIVSLARFAGLTGF